VAEPAAPMERSRTGRRRCGTAVARTGGATGRAALAVPAAVALALLALMALAAGSLRAQPRPGGSGPGWASLAERGHGYPAVVAHRIPGGVLTDVTVDGGRLTARAGDRLLELRAGSPFYRLGGEVSQLANPPYRDDGGFWIPTELLARLAGGSGDGAAPAGRVATSGAASDPSSVDGASRTAHGGPFRVVIDPGHGGKDPGAHGPRGTLEKNVALAVARRLKRKLDAVPWIEASLTRNRDVFLPLARRSKIAVQRDADLFISIHCNSERGSSARGFETYFLSRARTQQAREVAIRENSAIQYEDPEDRPDLSDVQYILAANNQNMNVRQSAFFAGETQNYMRSRLSTPDRGVKQAGFYVLVGASGSMPAVLAEIGFISNPVEERFLASSSGQDELSSALSGAVTEYFEDYSKRLAAAGTGAPSSGGR